MSTSLLIIVMKTSSVKKDSIIKRIVFARKFQPHTIYKRYNNFKIFEASYDRWLDFFREKTPPSRKKKKKLNKAE